MGNTKFSYCSLCKENKEEIACPYCNDGSEFVKISNFDKIQYMDEKELAEFLIYERYNSELDIDEWICSDGTPFRVKDDAILYERRWLRKEVKEV